MEVEALDLVGLLEGPTPLPDELDDLFPEELMQYLTAVDGKQPACDGILEEVAPLHLPAGPAAPVASASSPTSSCQSNGKGSLAPSIAAASPSPGATPAPLLNAFPPHQLPEVQRLVTTTAAQQMWTAMLQAAYCTAPSATACAADITRVPTGQHAGSSLQGSRECSADSSDTDQDDMEMVDSKTKGGAGNKRKAPEVDWRQIEDPSERRRQRRLAKNRVTAARSRERKKAMWSELEDKLKIMENENLQLRAMLDQFARENASLKSQLLNMTRAGMQAGGVSAASQVRASKTTDPAVILPVFIVTLLVVCSLLPGDKAVALLGSVLPLALVASLALGVNGTGADCNGLGAASGQQAMDALFRLLHMLGTLVSGTSRTLQRSLKRLLFERHRYLGRSGMKRLAGCKARVPQLGSLGVTAGTLGELSSCPETQGVDLPDLSRGMVLGSSCATPAASASQALVVKAEPVR